MVFPVGMATATMDRSRRAPVTERRGNPMSLPGGHPLSTRVVVVDDIADLRWLLRAALNTDGRFDVVGEASDGQEAVSVVKLTQPDVVVLDLRMPKMDGLEALAQIVTVAPQT